VIAVTLSKLAVRGFRNLRDDSVAFGHRFNVISGNNGQGKTNLLEAIYVLATSKSFRTAKLPETIQFEQPLASVRGELSDGPSPRVQSVGIRAGARQVRVDDKRPSTLAAYALYTPIVAFFPTELSLSTGPSGERRRLLDRVALYTAPQSLAEGLAYARALRARQKTLAERGPNARDIADWETLMARHGTRVMQYREQAATALGRTAEAAFHRIATPGIALRVEYKMSGSTVEEDFLESLRVHRAVDARRGQATVGPHRDDLALWLDGRPVRAIASQGQHRAITLALKAAEIEAIEAVRGVRPILLLDDVSSELDPARTAALFAFLREQQGQVFLTTTRRELIDTGPQDAQRRDYVVHNGIVECDT